MRSLLPNGRRETDLPTWMRLAELYAAADRGPFGVVWEGSLSGVVEPFRTLDAKGAILCDEGAMYSHAGYALDWVRDALGLRQCEGWRASAPTTLVEFMKQFYDPASGAIAFIFVESCRLQIRKIHAATYQERPMEYRLPVFGRPRRWLELSDGLRLPVRQSRFASPPERAAGRTPLVRMAVRRTFGAGDAALDGYWTTWCAAAPGEDDADLAKAFVPAGRRCIQANGVNGARLMTWAKLDPLTGLTVSYSVDLDPNTGEIISVRRAAAPLELHAGITPHWDRVLQQCMRR